jgi:hypothetical protein
MHELYRVNGHHLPWRILSWALHDLATQLLRLLEDKLDVTPLGGDDTALPNSKLDNLLDDIAPSSSGERKAGASKAATSRAPTSLRALSQAACLQLLFDLKVHNSCRLSVVLFIAFHVDPSVGWLSLVCICSSSFTRIKPSRYSDQDTNVNEY